jgi:hypothetical protein
LPCIIFVRGEKRSDMTAEKREPLSTRLNPLQKQVRPPIPISSVTAARAPSITAEAHSLALPQMVPYIEQRITVKEKNLKYITPPVTE